MPPLTDTTSWSVIVGIALPWLVAVVNRPWWSRRVRQAVAIVASVIAGVLVCLGTGAFGDGSGLTVVGTCAIVLVASQAVYGRLFKGAVRKVEEATSGKPTESSAPEPPAEPVPEPPAEPTPEVFNDKPGKHAEDRVHTQPGTDDATERPSAGI